ncbi:MAG: ferrous iron transporter B, partial [Alphaproteobacteria bacterium]|nr:ferrous iron transporter B [Alphaproteobacteria bacterium]
MKPNEAGDLTIALIGSPNSGKSALFNQLSGAKQKVANYAGVTVERKEGAYLTPAGRQVRLIDLPGLYSLSALGQDEAITRQILQDSAALDKRFDLILCVVDATNLRLHLKLLLELKQLVAGQGLPVAVILNQIDMAEARGISIDLEPLSSELGCPVIPTVAIKPSGIADLSQFIENFGTKPAPQPTVEPPALMQDLHARVRAILRAAVVMPRKTARLDDRLDRVFLHPIGGMILLLLVLFVVFQSVFLLAQPFMDGIELVFDRLKNLVDLTMPPSHLHSFVTEAVLSGSGAVLIFLPQIIILFFFILVLEESGYLPRAAFLLDTIMAKFGLSGRSFIPLLSSFACAIPGIMATRTIHDRRDRVTTILVAPLMTCSARLPVYGLLIAAFIPERLVGGFISFQGLVLFCLYFAGIFSAALVAKLITQHQSRQLERSLILELPSYRLPQVKNLAYGLWERAMAFVKRISGIIFGVNALLWFLVSFPRPDALSLASGSP